MRMKRIVKCPPPPLILHFFFYINKEQQHRIYRCPDNPLFRKLTQVVAMASVCESTTSREGTFLSHLEVL